MKTTDININFQLAYEFVSQTSQPVFLTGKAGTGKTTFLKHVQATVSKNMVLLAPTGVAAINAGGSTLHSFFQLPFGPFTPEKQPGQYFAATPSQTEESMGATDSDSLLSRLRFSGEKRALIEALELMVIDEISMVRADLLDSVDTILRHVRKRYTVPFGGVQVLLIGDLFQLPPVMPDDQWKILQGYYQSPFFFDSRIIRESPPRYIELNKIYRQSEQHFIDVLNQVRNNALDEDGSELLHSRYIPDFDPQEDSNYILLTSHNYKADAVNTTELQKLDADSRIFDAGVTGDFSEKSFPAEKTLELKEGAQVMFIRNDADKSKRYFNGKIGVIAKIEKDEVHVRCDEAYDPIKVKKEVWRNVRYVLNKNNQKIEEEEIGTFTQFPLRLAWAITIHKSQGLTFEKAVIDAGKAFAPGQVYVALSRCTSLNGMVLHSRINPSNIFTDRRVVDYVNSQTATQELVPELNNAKRQYQGDLVRSLFEFDKLYQSADQLSIFLAGNKPYFNEPATPWAATLVSNAEKLKSISRKFWPELNRLLEEEIMPEENARLQERLASAAKYFSQALDEDLLTVLKKKVAESDNRQLSLTYQGYANQLYLLVLEKLRHFKKCEAGFNAARWLEKTQDPYPKDLNFVDQATRYYGNSPHPELFKQLKKLRDKICVESNQPVYLVAGTNTLEELSKYLPQTLEELLLIHGFGKTKVAKYGKEFLDIIKAYCEEKELDSLMIERAASKVEEKVELKNDKSGKQRTSNKKGASGENDSAYQSLAMFSLGQSIPVIAESRKLALSTIQGHLVQFVRAGKLAVEKLVEQQKIEKILPLINGHSMASIKETLGPEFSYFEIRAVVQSSLKQPPIVDVET